MRRGWARSPGTWISVAVILFIGVLLVQAQIGRAGHRRQIAAAFGAANTFYGEPQMNHDGHRFTYVATTELRSCALYLCDTGNRQPHEVVSAPDGLGYWRDDYDLRAWAWSPDDSSFIYTMQDKLVICPVESTNGRAELTVGVGAVSQVVWLTPTQFAFVEQGNILYWVRKQINGRWLQRQLPCNDAISSLTAVDSHTIAWLQNGLICRLNLDEYPAGTTDPVPPVTPLVPDSIISWSHNVWGFDNAAENSGRPVPDTVSGVAPAPNWNDTWAENSAKVQFKGVTVENLFDSAGTVTGAGITYAAWNSASLVGYHVGPDADGSYNRELLNGFLHAGPAAWGPPITNSFVSLTGIPFTHYDVVVYFGSEVGGRHGRISDGVANYYFSTVGAAEVSGSNALFLPATQTNGTEFPGADFAFFPGLTNRSQTFTCLPLSGNDRWLGIAGIQVIQASNVYVLPGPAPVNKIVTVGQPTSFCLLAGGWHPSYQWRHAGTNLLNATNATYSVASTVAGQEGDYDVIVANRYGSVTGGVATLTFDTPKTIPLDASGLAQSGSPFLPSTPDTQAALPTDGLTLWLDASTLQQPDQTPVNRLTDLSPSQNTAFADGPPPTYNAPDSLRALNDRGTIHFSDAGSINHATGLKTGRRLGITGSSPRTLFAVMRRAGNKSMLISAGDAGTQGAYFGLCDQNDALYLPAGMVTDNRLEAVAPQWHILSVEDDGITQRGFVNGAFKGAVTLALHTADAEVQLGIRRVKSGDARQTAASDGDFAELLIYDRALNTDERQQIETYLSRKWFGGRVITAQSPLVWVDPKMNGITGFTRSKTTGQLLIRADSRAGTSLWRYDFNTGLSRLVQADFIRDAQWVGSNEFAYLGRKSGHQELVLADGTGTEKARLFDQGNVNWFEMASCGGKLSFSGVVSNEPANGLWQYDLETGKYQSLVAYSDHPFEGAKRIPPFRSFIKWPSLSCLIYPPATVDRHKKYPLVITDTLSYDAIHGPMFQSAIADCGAYVVIVERNSWYGGIEQWGTNVLNVYQKLKLDPAVDPEQVYLFGSSAETRYLSELVEKTPGLWKGVILLNPAGLPDFSNSARSQKRPKILIIAGGEEHEDKYLKKYQEDSLKDGVMVEYLISPGEAHRFIGKAAKLERAQAVDQFIFEE
jgi:hypothetical protein